MAETKMRLDRLLVDRGVVASRSQGQAMILAGDVSVKGIPSAKPGMLVRSDVEITIKEPARYASRGGFKLAAALDGFEVALEGSVCADVGACTGGFTDVMLQRGAVRVYAIDVGYGQLDWRLRQDDRVVPMERTNVRYVEALPEPVLFVGVDVSFISLRLVLPVVTQWLAPGADIVALVKPQFEAGKGKVGKGGVVKDPSIHAEVVRSFITWARRKGLSPQGLIRSPIKGAAGNVEFLVWLRPDGEHVSGLEDQIQRVAAVVD